MDVDEALRIVHGQSEPAPGVAHALAREVERLRPIEARAQSVAFWDGGLFGVPAPETHWIGQYILKGDPDLS
jgi:hypothetical protein